MKQRPKPVFVIKADSSGIVAAKEGKIQKVSRYFLKSQIGKFRSKLPRDGK